MSTTVPTGQAAADETTATVSRRSPRRRRGAELGLLLLAYLLSVAAHAQVDQVVTGRVGADTWRFAAVFGGALLVAHVVVRLLARDADPVVLPVVAVLNGLGLVMIHRIDLIPGQAAGGRPPDSVLQLGWMALGVLLFVGTLAAVRDHRVLQRYTYTSMAVGLVLLLLPLLPVVGTEINGARIWIRLGELSFQPAEAAKLFILVFFAGYLVVKRDVLALARTRVLGVDLPRGRDLGPILLVWVISLAVLVFERDLGTSLLLFGVFVGMLYIATERSSWILIGLLLFVAGATFAYFAFPHVQVRFQVWWNPFADESGNGYQIAQSLYGLASGGLLGSGLGGGHPEFVPFAKSDFITSALGEELGLTGLLAIIVLVAILVERGVRTGLAVRDGFGKLLAAGISLTLGLQFFIVVGGVTRLIPLTGLTTPFLSYGGSSLVVNWLLVALLLRISDAARGAR